MRAVLLAALLVGCEQRTVQVDLRYERALAVARAQLGTGVNCADRDGLAVCQLSEGQLALCSGEPTQDISTRLTAGCNVLNPTTVRVVTVAYPFVIPVVRETQAEKP